MEKTFHQGEACLIMETAALISAPPDHPCVIKYLISSIASPYDPIAEPTAPKAHATTSPGVRPAREELEVGLGRIFINSSPASVNGATSSGYWFLNSADC